MPTSTFHQHFPGYEILGELGRSNARVLKARNQSTGELVAIKHFSFNTDAATLRRFQQESEIMVTIKHPNIVKIKEVQLDVEMPYVVMELIEGGDLRSLLREQGHLDVPTTIRLGLQMAEAFKAIHQQGIIHRDIKPENIMYRLLPSGELHFLLTDFGIAKIREQSVTVTGQSLMTYEYASPEQFDNPKGVTVATDYYSLGVVLYECLSGRVPFIMEEGRVRLFINGVMDTPPPPLSVPQLPESLRALVNSLLAKKPEERIKDELTLKRKCKRAELEESEGQWDESPIVSPPETGIKPVAPAQSPDRQDIVMDDNQVKNPSPWDPPTGIIRKQKNRTREIIVVIMSLLFIVPAVIKYFPAIEQKLRNSNTRTRYAGDTTPAAYPYTPPISADTNSPSGTTPDSLLNSHNITTHQWSNGEKYEGGWENGHAEGQGNYYDANGKLVYDGTYKYGKRDGYGTSYNNNGDTLYSGQWKNDLKDGLGTFYWENGDRYFGDWVGDYRNGKGTYYWQNGNTYEGEWYNDQRSGKGNYYWKNTGRYEGDWKNDKMDGFGRYYDGNGKLLYEGEWKADQAVETFPNRQ